MFFGCPHSRQHVVMITLVTNLACSHCKLATHGSSVNLVVPCTFGATVATSLTQDSCTVAICQLCHWALGSTAKHSTAQHSRAQHCTAHNSSMDCTGQHVKHIALHLLMMLAELVLPMPGGPLRSMAFLDRSLGLPRPFTSAACSCRKCTPSLQPTHCLSRQQ